MQSHLRDQRSHCTLIKLLPTQLFKKWETSPQLCLWIPTSLTPFNNEPVVFSRQVFLRCFWGVFPNHLLPLAQFFCNILLWWNSEKTCIYKNQLSSWDATLNVCIVGFDHDRVLFMCYLENVGSQQGPMTQISNPKSNIFLKESNK